MCSRFVTVVGIGREVSPHTGNCIYGKQCSKWWHIYYKDYVPSIKHTSRSVTHGPQPAPITPASIPSALMS
ncbi:unnamed protein product [Oppiella nova]|uniref:Uncharacterized protein n=1 Tax=Oppiella nova TaxID=334625 RepID=A0A7R9LNG2_9ACAR|nr:unnamed protein product [Oppiella nova]CAG2165391.1 unnamed protein product [Oppiella nova]